MRYFILITCLIGYLNSFSQLTATISSFNHVTCLGNCDGNATVSAVGGTPPYTYSWTNGATTATINNLCAGIYTVTVTDAIAATDTAVVTINQLNTLSVLLNITAEDTCGTCVGGINSLVSGGIPPYTYMWSLSGDTIQNVSGLCGGYHELLVIDSVGCFGINGETIDTVGSAICPQFITSTISGTVYNDINSNCIKDPSDEGITGVLFEATPGPYYASSDSSGTYSFTLPYGTYTITQVPPTYYDEICPVAGSYSVLLDSLNSPITNIDFADTTVSIQDVSITLIPFGSPVPGFQLSYFMQYTSHDATPTNGTVYLTVDDSLVYVNSNPLPTLISGDTLFWNYTNLQQLETRFITAQFQTPANVNLLGDTMIACAHITPLIGDVVPSNNTDCRNQVVVGSYDPNDKRVVPAGAGPTGDILLSETELLYKIRFQNSGTLFATNVVVKDTLSPNLDISSLRNVVATHPFTYEVTGQGELTFSFLNIMLPDSNVDEPGSHGAIEFTIDQHASNAIGTVIENTAHIYFDFNPSIVTNTVVNTIVAITSVEETMSIDYNANIYPNPTSTLLFVDTRLEVKTVNILDLTGKLIKTVSLKNNSVNVADLTNGIYFIQLINNEKTITKKFVKQ